MLEYFFWFSSILATWFFSRRYYLLSKKDSEGIISSYKLANKSLIDEIKKINSDDKIALNEERISKAVVDYLKRGTPKYIIDTFTDLSQEEKAEMYDLILLRAKGKIGLNNPYK